MCQTPWCFGDCEECLYDAKWEKENEEANAQCPHRKECNWVTVHVKQDKCTNCGEVFNYP